MTVIRITPSPAVSPRPAESHSWPVSITGVSVVRDRRAHWVRRLIWVLILSIALITFIWEMFKGVRRLQEAHITKSWSHSSPSELVLPALTLCSMAGVKPSVVLNSTIANTTLVDWAQLGLELLRWGELDLEQFLDSASYRWEDMVMTCQVGGRPCSESAVVSHQFSRLLGQCHTLTPRGTVPRARLLPQLRLSLFESEPMASSRYHQGWIISLHPAGVRWTDTSTLVGISTVLMVPPQVFSQFTLRRTRTNRLSTSSAPCDRHASTDDVVHCYNSCLAGGRGGNQTASCRLPWLVKQVNGTPPCTSYQQFLEATNHDRVFLNVSGSESQLLEALSACSHCSPSCSSESFTVQSRDRTQLPPDPEMPDLVAAELTILLESDVEDVIEKYDYEFSTMISDIGGIAGLLLGASVLTLFELVDSLTAARRR